ncbi:uncharacterized protein LOC143027691 isoform X2 [Oratosquilla oratoria]|uniref:uncharacterized protein LOC143027691 isoform X2 n=1 Tax=Oratosquilla oratoria TaxID=337810 RepID=UPI003F76AA96
MMAHYQFYPSRPYKFCFSIFSLQPTKDAGYVPVVERGIVGPLVVGTMSGVEVPHGSPTGEGPQAPQHPPSQPPSPIHAGITTTDSLVSHPAESITRTSSTSITTALCRTSSSCSVPGSRPQHHPGEVSRTLSNTAAAGRGRRKLENEDSSYDSDFEASDCPVSPREDEDDDHEDVCRTVSDTLGAEFAEYVTSPPGSVRGAQSGGDVKPQATKTPPATTTATTTVTSTKSEAVVVATTTTTTTTSILSRCASSPPEAFVTKNVSERAEGAPAQPVAVAATRTRSLATPTLSVTPAVGGTTPVTSASQVVSPAGAGTCLKRITSSPGYGARVEFGVKLGYTEALVQLALTKLGDNPGKDELLAELIRLGATVPRGEGEVEVESHDVTATGASSAAVEGREDPEQTSQLLSGLRPIIIDGSNVAISHGDKTTFSCRGLRLCVDWFRARGHTEITVFVPRWRKETSRWDTPITDQEVLLELEREHCLVFTPSRVFGGKRIVSYDDRYILKEAAATGGIVVSNDNYRDLANEAQFRRVVEESILMYSWVKGRFVPPDDPLGRNGPTLDAFLRRARPQDPHKALCPYGRKCTYGNKCKYIHPERGAAPIKSVTELLQEQVQRHYHDKAKSIADGSTSGQGAVKSNSLPAVSSDSDIKKKPLTRTQSTVPTVSVTLPTALTQEAPTQDMSEPPPPTSSPIHRQILHPGSSLDAHLMEPGPLDPHRAHMYKSESSLYPMYAAQNPQVTPGGTWSWKGQHSDSTAQQQQQQQQQEQQQQQGLTQQHSFSSQLPLGKQLSDPDSASSENPHRKLHRQLTLNPTYDVRLYKIKGFREPPPERFTLPGRSPSQESQSQPPNQQPQQPQAPPSPSRSHKGDLDHFMPYSRQGSTCQRASPSYTSPYGSREHLAPALHQPLGRHSSTQEGSRLMSLPPHMYPPYSHPYVTRNASAPTPIWGAGQQQQQQQQQQQTTQGPSLITRLNSTSDTQLNVYGCNSDSTQYLGDVFDDNSLRPPAYHPPPSTAHHTLSPSAGAPSPGPIGSRPMSPQQQQQQQQQPPQVRSPHHSVSVAHLGAPLIGAQLHPSVGSSGSNSSGSSSVPHSPSYTMPLTAAASLEDTRLKVFYHLSQLFPEAQVRAVLTRYPDETDPQKICAAILALNSGQS